MEKSVLYVGLDVHKMSMDVTIAEAGPGAEVGFTGAAAAIWRPWTR